MVERISFTSGATPYNTMLAAEHMARYLLAQPLCVGKRVLDIACGEGYGTSFLKESGAATVVGIDIAQEAIDAANARLAGPGITFLASDALSPATFQGHGPFDLITCFETIEHVTDPGALLGNLRDMLAPGGAIIVSCPNDAIDKSRGIQNPYHQRIYTLQEFKETTEAVLGPATQWLLGTPLTGLTIIPRDNQKLQNGSTAMELALQTDVVERSFMIPAQKNQSVEAETATFFVGLWNASAQATQVVAPMSRPSYLEYWFEIERLKSVAADQAADIAHYRELARVSEERAREIRRIAAFEKDTLVAEVTELRYFHDVAYQSRAHRVAAAYIRHASGGGFVARVLRLFRRIAGKCLRVVRKLVR